MINALYKDPSVAVVSGSGVPMNAARNAASLFAATQTESHSKTVPILEGSPTLAPHLIFFSKRPHSQRTVTSEVQVTTSQFELLPTL